MEPAGAGVLRVLRDVIVQEIGVDELMVIDREPAALGEVLTLELAELDAGPSVPARVIESRPVVVEGVVRHRLRLRRLPSQDLPPEAR